MSSGGMAQLLARGSQDEMLTVNPQTSFFETTYKRHVNFARVTDAQVIQGEPVAGGMSTVKFEKRGDLLNYVYITMIDLDENLVHSVQDWRDVIEHVELYIGGSLIDSQTSEFCELIAIDTMAQNLTMSSAGGHHDGAGRLSEFYPLRFFFNGSVSSSLPLFALSLSEVEIRIYWSTQDRWNSLDADKKPMVPPHYRFEVHANYIFLDDSERNRILSKPITMIVSQTQTIYSSNTNVMDLTFYHPVKYIASSAAKYNADLKRDPTTGNYLPNELNGLCDLKTKVKLQINGEDVGDWKYAVPHYTSVMSYYHVPFDNGNYQTHFLYPFCVNTSSLQPMGALNFSRIESARLLTMGQPISGTVYAVNQNFLIIKQGLAALMYAC